MQMPKKNLDINSSENCIGNHIQHSNNCVDCYTVQNVNNAKRCNTILDMNNAYDSNQVGVNTERIYEIMTCSMEIYNCRF